MWQSLICLLFCFLLSVFCYGEVVSRTVREVLREGLPVEDLVCVEKEGSVEIRGATYRYVVEKGTGAIVDVEVWREGEVVVKLTEPWNVRVDDGKQVEVMKGETVVEECERNRVVVRTEGRWGSDMDCTIRTVFYNDGVVVSEFNFVPKVDVSLSQGIWQDLSARGCFSHFLHKRRDTHGFDCYQRRIPKAGEVSRVYTPTSCLEVYSGKSALAMFTDMGDYYRSPAELDTGAVRVDGVEGESALVNVHQHLIHVGEKGERYVLSAGKPFRFRVGLAVAPNRMPHLRSRDLRMFIWVGDEKYPYPTDEEIWTVARLGFTLFQMHRLGPPGEPRPPAEELERVIRTVHEAGMLFIWTTNADLQYAHAEGVKKRMEEGRWVEWEGFNYGGRYKASMDSFCDLVATCLASPNSLADYRMECNRRMMERYAVDGMYIDDNLAYANCKRWKEHGHPQEVYDCLIELHEVNWRQREVLKERIPHVVLIDHCSKAFVLPVIAPFDVHLYGEGYDFSSVEEFRATFGSFSNMYAQGCLYSGDDEDERCSVENAYAYDLLTGGGQYCTIDWRLFPKKFPYAKGVKPEEVDYIRTYNLLQYYFGMYETGPLVELKTSAEGVYAVLYHNQVWNDYLLVVANMRGEKKESSVMGLESCVQAGKEYVVYDVHQRRVIGRSGGSMEEVFRNVLVENRLRVFCLKSIVEGVPYHLWGGKRLEEKWDVDVGLLTVKLDAPKGVEDWVVCGRGGKVVKKVLVNSKPAEFYYDVEKDLVFGKVYFVTQPVVLEVHVALEGKDKEGLPAGKLVGAEVR